MLSKILCFLLLFAAALPIAAQQETVRPTTMQTITKSICEPAAFTVAARQAKNCTFTVAEGHTAKLEGHFAATGGPRNTIEAWVLDDDAYVNWANHHQVRALYNSQKVTVGTIKLYLQPGKYHVVFDNLFSIMTPKAIEANMALEYKALQTGTN